MATYNNRIMSSNPNEVLSNPYQKQSSGLPDSYFERASSNYKGPGIAGLSSGMLGSAGNPAGNSTRIGSSGANSYVPSFNDTTNPQPKPASPSLPAAPSVNYSDAGGKDMNEMLRPATSGSSLPATTSPPTTSISGNDLSTANRYDAASKVYQDMRGDANPNGGLAGMNGMNAQMQQFFSALGSMLNTGQPGGITPEGLNSLFGRGQQKQEAPQMVSGDNSRFANDPFKVSANALR